MILVVLFLIYFGIQIGYSFFGNGHKVEYYVTTEGKKFIINEEFSNRKEDVESYFFEINYNDNIFYYQTSYDFKKSKEIIENIYYYSDNDYSCILPIYENNQIISDILCKKDNIIYNYQNIKGQNKKLDDYVLGLKNIGYEETKFNDNSSVLEKGILSIYEKNVLERTYYGLTNYKGLYLINSVTGGMMKDVSLFNKDVYKRPLSIFFKKYYIVANYNEDYRFDLFYIVDITNGKVKELKIGKEVSFDSYFQGAENDSLYFFDKTSKIQYEINIKTNKIIEVGNENTGIKVLKNGEWDRIDAKQAANDKVLFLNDNEVFSNYNKVDKLGLTSGYYYLYSKENNIFKAYRTNIQNQTQLIYLFDTSDVERIVYNKNNVYYIKNNCLKYYSDNIGERNLVCDNELNYNNSIMFGVYSN